MKVRLGSEFQDFRHSLEMAPPVSIRYNPNKKSVPIGEKIPWTEWGHYLPERPVFTLEPDFHAGAYYVQEASSMLLEQALLQTVDLTQFLNVLDLCAAPGGKSTHALSLLSKESLLVSNEVIRSRASILSENIQKWGHDNVVVTNNDPQDFKRLSGFFDVIIADSPCSGEGLFRKEPESIHQWSEKNVELCSLRQRRILSDIWPSLKPGGILVYSTCTFNEHENIENLNWLSAEESVEFLPLSLPAAWGIEPVRSKQSIGYQCFPHKVKGEGFFLSVMKKKDGAQASIKSKDTLKYPSKIQIKDIAPWISNPESQCLFQHHETVRMLPLGKREEFQMVLNNLHVVMAGTAVLEITKNKFVPDHGLALSIKLKKSNFSIIQVSREQALAYLRKETLNIASQPLGFALIEYDGLGLGWVNVLQNRINNLYPPSWRIRI